MPQIQIYSYPKINLALDVLGRDPSGYHIIQTVFYELQEPFDELIIEEIPQDRVEIVCDHPRVPLDEKNTVFKTALLIKKHFGIKKGVKISIKKRIPVMSGLGGGASNAAATLKGLSILWKISCACHPELVEGLQRHPIALQQAQHGKSCLFLSLLQQIGMDCAFFLHGGLPTGQAGTALGEHFGEKITPLPPLPPELQFQIIETGIEISSHNAYQNIDLSKCGKEKGKTEKLITAIQAGDAEKILKNIHNDFEYATQKYEAPFLRALQNERSRTKGLHQAIHLCGSGGALFQARLIPAYQPLRPGQARFSTKVRLPYRA